MSRAEHTMPDYKPTPLDVARQARAEAKRKRRQEKALIRLSEQAERLALRY